ncbi:hypothetical protein PtA15_14A380 [Puccinia triticina]|uniref:Uncharacterized protein n=1 Tax=Puccinia triticina TaxID=208348 RepID=A0ABY7D581_9BASI|nr:uncharacterized protein PtA15_14A380 [Puccinia triticina]WAQ91496.1 hypothetical protein PtA15_14A380 [Puccinia triticina]WAR62307.1 hypothetical protein PtB15_14B402 [Puccinia triticina]
MVQLPPRVVILTNAFGRNFGGLSVRLCFRPNCMVIEEQSAELLLPESSSFVRSATEIKALSQSGYSGWPKALQADWSNKEEGDLTNSGVKSLREIAFWTARLVLRSALISLDSSSLHPPGTRLIKNIPSSPPIQLLPTFERLTESWMVWVDDICRLICDLRERWVGEVGLQGVPQRESALRRLGKLR